MVVQGTVSQIVLECQTFLVQIWSGVRQVTWTFCGQQVDLQVQGSKQQSPQVVSQWVTHLPGTQYGSSTHSPHFLVTTLQVVTGLQTYWTHSLQCVSMHSL